MGFELKALKAINNLEIIDNSLEIIQQFVFWVTSYSILLMKWGLYAFTIFHLDRIPPV